MHVFRPEFIRQPLLMPIQPGARTNPDPQRRQPQAGDSKPFSRGSAPLAEPPKEKPSNHIDVTA